MQGTARYAAHSRAHRPAPIAPQQARSSCHAAAAPPIPPSHRALSHLPTLLFVGYWAAARPSAREVDQWSPTPSSPTTREIFLAATSRWTPSRTTMRSSSVPSSTRCGTSTARRISRVLPAYPPALPFGFDLLRLTRPRPRHAPWLPLPEDPQEWKASFLIRTQNRNRPLSGRRLPEGANTLIHLPKCIACPNLAQCMQGEKGETHCRGNRGSSSSD